MRGEVGRRNICEVRIKEAGKRKRTIIGELYTKKLYAGDGMLSGLGAPRMFWTLPTSEPIKIRNKTPQSRGWGKGGTCFWTLGVENPAST